MYSMSSSVIASSERSEGGEGWRGGSCCLFTTSAGRRGVEGGKEVYIHVNEKEVDGGRDRERKRGTGRERKSRRDRRMER